MINAAEVSEQTAFRVTADPQIPTVDRHEQLQYETEQAFVEVVEQYSELAYNVALRMLRNPADAEDAVQEAFISAYKAFPKFRGQSKASTWLYRIVVNACLMKIRKEKSRSRYLADTGFEDLVVPDWRDDPEDATVNGELRDTIQLGLDQLSPELRASIVLRDVQGLSTEEAAQAVGLSPAAFKSRLHRARVLLRKHLSGYLSKT